MKKLYLLKILIGLLVLGSNVKTSATDSCPQETDLLRRIGDTRFFIIQKNERGHFVNASDAEAQCKQFGLTMAKITNMRTFAIVGRNLEKLVLKNELKDTWYWLPAIFTGDFYKWKDNGKRLEFNNFLYRKPRPTGVMGMVNYMDVYEIDRNDPQCLAVALPWFGPYEVSPSYSIRGHQFSVEERPCVSVQTRHAICESNSPKCNSTKEGPFLLTEDKIDYFEHGDWILGNRTFIINWNMRTRDESINYCNRLKMKIYEPSEQDDGLIPFIKMWSKDTDLSWDPKYIKDVDLALTSMATIPFGIPDNSFTQRSTYKQTFGSLVCPPGFVMLRMNNTIWSTKPHRGSIIDHDYLESYWVVDEDFFNKNIDSKCTITTPKDKNQGFDRILKKVPCTEWYFYLCQKRPLKRYVKFTGKVNKWKEMLWKEGPQERAYPILL